MTGVGGIFPKSLFANRLKSFMAKKSSLPSGKGKVNTNLYKPKSLAQTQQAARQPADQLNLRAVASGLNPTNAFAETLRIRERLIEEGKAPMGTAGFSPMQQEFGSRVQGQSAIPQLSAILAEANEVVLEQPLTTSLSNLQLIQFINPGSGANLDAQRKLLGLFNTEVEKTKGSQGTIIKAAEKEISPFLDSAEGSIREISNILTGSSEGGGEVTISEETLSQVTDAKEDIDSKIETFNEVLDIKGKDKLSKQDKKLVNEIVSLLEDTSEDLDELYTTLSGLSTGAIGNGDGVSVSVSTEDFQASFDRIQAAINEANSQVQNFTADFSEGLEAVDSVESDAAALSAKLEELLARSDDSDDDDDDDDDGDDDDDDDNNQDATALEQAQEAATGLFEGLTSSLSSIEASIENDATAVQDTAVQDEVRDLTRNLQSSLNSNQAKYDRAIEEDFEQLAANTRGALDLVSEFPIAFGTQGLKDLAIGTVESLDEFVDNVKNVYAKLYGGSGEVKDLQDDITVTDETVRGIPVLPGAIGEGDGRSQKIFRRPVPNSPISGDIQVGTQSLAQIHSNISSVSENALGLSGLVNQFSPFGSTSTSILSGALTPSLLPQQNNSFSFSSIGGGSFFGGGGSFFGGGGSFFGGGGSFFGGGGSFFF